MSSISIRFLATFGLVLGAFCVGRQGYAEERDYKSSASAKTSSTAREKPADTAAQSAAGPAPIFGGRLTSGFDRSLGSRQGPQTPSPNETLAVLKSGPEHTRLVYHLKSAPAYNISSTVSLLLRQEGELHGSGGTAAKSGPALRVAIAPDTVTNCLVISGPPDAVEEVRTLVEKMDLPPPMVQFEMEMGEAPVGDAKHGEGPTSEGGAPPAGRPNAFRVLERPKTMKTTARARVLTLDNQPAFIQLGQRVPMITGVSKGAAAGMTQSVTMHNVGLILGVTPRINVKDGTVVLQVDAEESQVGPENEGVPLSAAGDKVLRSPRIIDAVTVQTTVMIRDGETIILGSVARQGKTDKELVIILTPHIIPPQGGKGPFAVVAATNSAHIAMQPGKNGQPVSARHTVIKPARTDEDLAHIDSDVDGIILRKAKVTDAGLARLAEFSKLRLLWLDDTSISDSGLKSLRGLGSLRDLSLGRTGTTDAALKHLAGLKQLESLSLSGDNITDAGLEQLKALPHLKSLILDDTQVTDAGVESLERLDRLEFVSMNRARITDVGLKRLARLPRLDSLHLWGTQVTDAGLVSLKGLSQLKSLSFGETNVTGGGVASLRGLSGLQELFLTRTKVTDAGLENLKDLPRLQRLTLDGTNVTDASLNQFQGMRQLLELDLSGAKVTDEGVEKLRKALPKCKIEWPTPPAR